MGDDVNDCEEHDGPCDGFVCDVITRHESEVYGKGPGRTGKGSRKVIFLSKGMTPFNGVRLSKLMKFLHTGSKMKATSTWRVKAADRAMEYVMW